MLYLVREIRNSVTQEPGVGPIHLGSKRTRTASGMQLVRVVPFCFCATQTLA